MEVSTSIINGLSLGIEYVPANEEDEIEFSCLVIDLFVVRIVLEFTGS